MNAVARIGCLLNTSGGTILSREIVISPPHGEAFDGTCTASELTGSCRSRDGWSMGRRDVGASARAAQPPAGAWMSAPPVNDLPNPYNTIEGWAKLPEGRTWGSTSAVDIDKDGRSIWVAERCQVNSAGMRPKARCRRSNTVFKFDPSGKMVTSFGQGMFIFPHGIHVDRDGNVWVTDGQRQPAAPRVPGSPPTRRCRRCRRRSSATRSSSSAPTARCC